MVDVKRVGEIKTIEGDSLVDYIADGIVYLEGEEIPCKIGYNAYPGYDPEDEDILRADYIFIGDGITDNGTHYNRETINVNDRGISILDEEGTL